MPSIPGLYSPNDVTAVAAGTPLDGFTQGTFITAEVQQDAATAKMGADGYTAFSVIRADRLIQVTITLMQTSLSNNYLTGLLASQRAGGPPFPLAILNSTGGEAVTISAAVIAKEPAASFDVEAGGREWTFIGPGSIQPAGSVA